jgi:hypothetical protein
VTRGFKADADEVIVRRLREANPDVLGSGRSENRLTRCAEVRLGHLEPAPRRRTGDAEFGSEERDRTAVSAPRSTGIPLLTGAGVCGGVGDLGLGWWVSSGSQTTFARP